MNDDLYRNTAFEPFYENFEGEVTIGCVSMRLAAMFPPTRRELISRWFHQRLSVRPRPWKLCIPVECPPLQEYHLDPEVIKAMTRPL